MQITDIYFVMQKTKRVLLVDDDQNILQMLEKQLKRELPFVDVFCLFDGVAASQEVEKEKFDLILTDLNMPRKTGHSLLKRIQFSKHNSDTPLVVLTGFPDENLHREFAPIYQVEKPFLGKELIQLVKSLLEIDKRQLKHHHDMFQAFLAGLESICHKRGIEIHRIAQPWVRKTGHNLDGYLHLFFDFDIDRSNQSFNISLEKDAISRLYQEYTGKIIINEDEKFLVAGDELLKILFNELSSYLSNMDLKEPQLSYHGTVIGTESPQYQKAQTQQGLCIGIQTSVGTMYIQSLMDTAKLKQIPA